MSICGPFLSSYDDLNNIKTKISVIFHKNVKSLPILASNCVTCNTKYFIVQHMGICHLSK